MFNGEVPHGGCACGRVISFFFKGEKVFVGIIYIFFVHCLCKIFHKYIALLGVSLERMKSQVFLLLNI